MRTIEKSAPIMMTTIIGVFVLAVVFAGTGVVFIYLGASGTTDLSFFGATVKTTSAGVAALVLAAAVVVLAIRQVFSYMRFVVRDRGRDV
jgi:hypothetical protein